MQVESMLREESGLVVRTRAADEVQLLKEFYLPVVTS